MTYIYTINRSYAIAYIFLVKPCYFCSMYLNLKQGASQIVFICSHCAGRIRFQATLAPNPITCNKMLRRGAATRRDDS